MIFPIVVYGDPVLREKSASLGPDYPDLKGFLENFWETMYHADGVGLAAPQVGLSIRIFVIDAGALSEDDPSLKDFKKTFINPEIYSYSGPKRSLEEGCLSLPEIREQVPRSDSIRIRYLDENFQEHDEEYRGFLARVIQHEYDHLEGRLFIDYLLPLKRKLLKGKLNSIARGKITPHYSIRVPV